MKKRYAAGDEVAEGPNKNIDDDTRERAMEYIRRNAEREEGERGAPAKPAAKPAAKSSPAPSIKPARPSYSGEMSSEDLAKIKGREQSSESSKDVPPLPSGKENRTNPVVWSVWLGRCFRVLRSPAKGRRVRCLLVWLACPLRLGARLKLLARLLLLRVMAGVLARWRKPPPVAKRATRASAGKKTVWKAKARLGPFRLNCQRALLSVNARGRVRKTGWPKKAVPTSSAAGVKKYAGGGMVSASRRADGIAQRGKTKGRIY